MPPSDWSKNVTAFSLAPSVDYSDRRAITLTSQHVARPRRHPHAHDHEADHRRDRRGGARSAAHRRHGRGQRPPLHPRDGHRRHRLPGDLHVRRSRRLVLRERREVRRRRHRRQGGRHRGRRPLRHRGCPPLRLLRATRRTLRSLRRAHPPVRGCPPRWPRVRRRVPQVPHRG